MFLSFTTTEPQIPRKNPQCQNDASKHLGIPGIHSLACAEVGRDLCVRRMDHKDACCRQRLREMGLLEGRTIRLISNHDPLICMVGDSRIGLCKRLASGVLVESINHVPTPR